MPNGAVEPSPGWGRRLLWLLLPAFASLTFLATTNHVCQDVAVIPFLWIAPLSLYLLSFIICFDHERWYIPRLYAGGDAVRVPRRRCLGHAKRVDASYVKNGSGRLRQDSIRRRAELRRHVSCLHAVPRRIGSPAASSAASDDVLSIDCRGRSRGRAVRQPRGADDFSAGYTEWAIALLGGCLLAVAIIVGTEEKGSFRQHPWLFVPGFILLAGGLYWGASTGLNTNTNVIAAKRNFYGVVSVVTSKITSLSVL